MARRRGIILFTIATSIVSLAVYVWALAVHTANPLWNRVLITYSLVFWVFLSFDGIGRGLVAHSATKKTAVPHRPQPKIGEADMVFAPGATEDQPLWGQQVVQTRLVRLTENEVERFEQFVSEFAREVHALADESISEEQARREFPIRTWLKDTSILPFFVESGGQRAGVIVAREREMGWDLLVVYVRPEIRRHGVGEAAIQALRDFLQLLGGSSALSSQVSVKNVRAERFFEKVGIDVSEDAMNA